MPGPNSAPNGDRSLTLSKKIAEGMVYCSACRGTFPKRAHLAKHGKLRTGKTGR